MKVVVVTSFIPLPDLHGQVRWLFINNSTNGEFNENLSLHGQRLQLRRTGDYPVERRPSYAHPYLMEK